MSRDIGSRSGCDPPTGREGGRGGVTTKPRWIRLNVSPHPARRLRAARSGRLATLPLQPKSDVSDFGPLKVPNSGKPEFGWEGGSAGLALGSHRRCSLL